MSELKIAVVDIIVLLVLFAIVTRVLSLNDEINEWRDKIKDLES